MAGAVLILASSSERRKRILAECGVRFRAVRARVKEQNNLDGGVTRSVVHNARIKAEDVSRRMGGGVVLGADTLVLFEGETIGKPADFKSAKKLFERFSGKKLKVYTGLCVINYDTGGKASGWEETDVRVGKIKSEETGIYLRHLGPFDKAGGFSIEGPGSLVFDDIRGSYYNVLGLPMGKLADVLRAAGADIFSFMDQSEI